MQTWRRLIASILITLLALAGSPPPVGAHGPLHDDIRRLTRAIEADPLCAECYLERGELHRLDENPAAATRDFDQAERILPTLPRLRLCRSALALDEGDPELALVLASSYLAHHPHDKGALELRARINDRLGRGVNAASDRTRLAAIQAAPAPGTTPATGAATVATTLIGRGASWKYLATAIDQGTAWRPTAFNDGGWPFGGAPLGFGETYIVTTVPFGPDTNNKWRTTYFRKSFNLAEAPGSLVSLTMTASYDDGFVAYLNGTEVARRGIAAGAVTWSTFATSHEAGTFETINLTSFIGLLATGNNVLAVELHQTSVTSSDLAWDADLSASAATSVTRGPYLQVLRSTGITVRWRTDAATDSRVRWGASPAALISTADDAVLTTEHEMALTGLTPGTRYYYSVGSIATPLAGGDSTFTFRTTPALAERTTIWIVGDSGDPLGSDDVRDGYLNYSNGAYPDLWLMLGDNAYNTGTDAEYQASVFDVYPNVLRRSVLWPTRGNHDVLYAGPVNDYYDIFTMPAAAQAGGSSSGTEAWYSFDYGDIHFICLDSEGSARTPGSAMLTWLATDLAASTKTWTIAYWHHPPYTKGSHDSDLDSDSGGRMKEMRVNVLPILESAGVDMVLCGHSHSYERSCLLDEHYGYSTSLHDSMKVDPGDGNPSGDGAYVKPTAGNAAPHEGAVYAVAGSSARIGGGSLNHPAMVSSRNVLGSMELVVDGLRLDAAFIDPAGLVQDSFVILKGGVSSVPDVGDRTGPIILAGRPNPFQSTWRLTGRLPAGGPARVDILDPAGRLVRTLLEAPLLDGPFELVWDGRDAAGRPVATGVYFARVVQGTRIATLKLIRID
ncbi:MAG: metallophosphoesterase [Candidatus Eisenbacteria bacterium]|nr:metallophosphoesterase [Candidatus Eisenbacteria bacterium]